MIARTLTKRTTSHSYTRNLILLIIIMIMIIIIDHYDENH